MPTIPNPVLICQIRKLTGQVKLLIFGLGQQVLQHSCLTLCPWDYDSSHRSHIRSLLNRTTTRLQSSSDNSFNPASKLQLLMHTVTVQLDLFLVGLLLLTAVGSHYYCIKLESLRTSKVVISLAFDTQAFTIHALLKSYQTGTALTLITI